MAKVKIQGHASGTGILTVTAPNTSTDRTITLPDATGTLLTADGDGSSLTGVGVDGISSSADATAITIASNETITLNATGGNGYSDAASKVLKTAGTQHTILSVETSSTGGHQAALELESNGNPVSISTAGANTMDFQTSGASAMNIDSAGIITKPLQPAFHIHPNASQLNFARGAIVAITFDTERFDLNNDFASSTFTAPVTGKYQLSASIALAAVNTDGGTNYYYIQIMTSNRSYYHLSDIARAGAVNWNLNCDVLADMDAGDTSSVKIIQGGSGGTGTSDVSSDSFFSGHLVC